MINNQTEDVVVETFFGSSAGYSGVQARACRSYTVQALKLKETGGVAITNRWEWLHQNMPDPTCFQAL